MDCGSSGAIGWNTLLRNAALVALWYRGCTGSVSVEYPSRWGCGAAWPGEKGAPKWHASTEWLDTPGERNALAADHS